MPRAAVASPLRPLARGLARLSTGRHALRFSLFLFAATAITTASLHGPLYAASLLAILLSHELGHYLMCRRYRVAATYPLFLPAPFFFGTFGAVIAIRAPFPDRKALFDIGAAGPIAGAILAIPITLIGIALSTIEPIAPAASESLYLGKSLLFGAAVQALTGLDPATHDLHLHPMALAGWLGLLVTGLNLLPIGQLDGGHIVYAMLGKDGAVRTTRWALIAFAALTLGVYAGWLLFFVLVMVMASRHPAPVDDATPLDAARVAIGIATMVLFVLTFTPAPIADVPPLLDLGLR